VTIDARTLRSAPIAVAAVLLIAAGAQFFLAEAITASQWSDPPYSYIVNDISDLGVPEQGEIFGRWIDSPAHLLMNVSLVATGVLSLTAQLLGARLLPLSSRIPVCLLAVVQALGIGSVGIFHGGPAAQADGTILWHFLGAFAAIIGGNTALILIGIVAWRRRRALYGIASALLGIIGWACYWTYMLALPSWEDPPRGAFERGCVYPILVWMILTGVALLTTRQPKAPRD